jgi:hypothetical protein
MQALNVGKKMPVKNLRAFNVLRRERDSSEGVPSGEPSVPLDNIVTS